MTTDAPLYKNQVMLLAQTFFIKDNQAELLLCAHKYDFEIVFFDEVNDFVMAVQYDDGDSLFVIDLDSLHSVQADMQQERRKTMNLGELLERLPTDHSYVYLQTNRQGGRFLLQQRLVDSNCLAYAEKPIANDVLVDKLFTLFVQRKRGDLIRLMYLGKQDFLDEPALLEKRISFERHLDAQTLHLRVKELQPDIVLIEESEYLGTDAVVRVLKRNIEADPVREITLLQQSADVGLTRSALANGFDEVLHLTERDVLTAQLVNRANKIRINKDLIGKDRATGLLNKIGLQRKAQELIQQAGREGRSLAFGIVDIDKFKTINDTWGHYFGDIVIKRLSLTLAPHIGEKDLLSRFGGEEFVVVFWDCTLEQGRERLDEMRRAFCAIPFEVKPGEIRQFSFSGGIAAYPAWKSENELFLRADAMLYEAKQGGRNQVRL
ncbi:MAG: diguanylate cyclase [Massilia sp.]